MSDPTKKSIVINKSFLSGSNGSSASTKNKSRKQSRPKIPDEVIKPSKLKQILLDKINAKRRAELSMASTSASASAAPLSYKDNAKYNKTHTGNNLGRAGGGDTLGGIDKEKEAKIFSDEFKKSLNFLDKYIQTKNTEKADKRQHSHSHSKTLKRASGTSLNEDILKSLHNSKNSNNNHNTSPHKTQLNVNTQLYQNSSATYGSNIMQRNVSPSRAVSPAPAQRDVSFATQYTPTPTHAPTHAPTHTHAHAGFQKIQLNIPKVNTNHTPTTAYTPRHEKITLALGKPSSVSIPGTTMTDAGNLIYTELPPELMPNAPMTMPIPMSISTPMLPSMLPIVSEPTPIDITDSFYPNIETFESASPSHSPTPSTSLSTSTSTFSPIKLTDDKPYGCLKGGKKPTFRLYNKTIKRSNHNNNDDDDIYTERQQKLNDIKNKHSHKRNSRVSTPPRNNNHIDDTLENEEKGEKREKPVNEINNSKSNRATKIRKRMRKTITKRFRLGKQGNVVGVLIKNNDTRKKIQKEHGLLKNKNLSDVKKYLVEQKLMKIGSTAPPNIIRKIYEDSVLTGEVENVAKDVILHNFLEENKMI